MNRNRSRNFLYSVLAVDYACDHQLFNRDDVSITEARELQGRRNYPFRKNELALITTGSGVVIRCSRNYREWVESRLVSKSRNDLFGYPALAMIDAYLKDHGQSLYGPVLGLTCEPEDLVSPKTPPGVAITVIGREGMKELSDLYDFRYAVSLQYDRQRPNRLAAMAKKGHRIIGMAGSCLDCEGLQQVGVNVLPEFRGSGIGTLVVATLTRAIMDKGDVPYYTPWPANIASINLAEYVGYRPVYIEAFAGDAADPEAG